MGEVVNLQGQPVNLAENHEFVSDCCRFREEIMDEAAVKKKWKFDDATWQQLGSDEELIAAVEAEQVRRVRTGQRKRERAQVLVTRAPDVVAKIMLDDSANARHRIDAAASLDKFAANGPEAAPAADRFIIRIDLSGGGGDHVEVYDKSISINADDTPDDGSATPQRSLPASIPDKRWDEDDDHNAVVATPAEKRPAKTIAHKPDRPVVERNSVGISRRKHDEVLAGWSPWIYSND